MGEVSEIVMANGLKIPGIGLGTWESCYKAISAIDRFMEILIETFGPTLDRFLGFALISTGQVSADNPAIAVIALYELCTEIQWMYFNVRRGIGQATKEVELENALDVALECGYRHIDTAYAYSNEAVIGRVLKKWFSSEKLKREDVFITTKLPMNGVHEDRVDMFMERSLKNLDLEYVDLYLIHFPVGTKLVEDGSTGWPDIDETDHLKIWKKMEEQVDAGKTKSIGLSNFNKRQIENIWNNCRIQPVCLQVEIHLFLQQPNLVRYCQEKNIAVVAYSPLGAPNYNNFSSKFGVTPKELPNILGNSTVKEVAEKHNKSSGQIALRFLIEKGIIPIPKSVTPSRIMKNFEVFDFQLDVDDMKKLEKLNAGELGRVIDFKLSERWSEHPEWPFPRRVKTLKQWTFNNNQ